MNFPSPNVFHEPLRLLYRYIVYRELDPSLNVTDLSQTYFL